MPTIDGCLFCSIVRHEIPADVVYEDEQVVAFTDIAPKAPVHALVVPKTHLADLTELSRDPVASAALISGVAATAQALGVASFRTVFNTGEAAGQTVFHVHAHVLAGGDQSTGF